VNRDGALSLEEFCTAMHLVVLRRNEIELPDTLPPVLQPYTPLVSSGTHWIYVLLRECTEYLTSVIGNVTIDCYLDTFDCVVGSEMELEQSTKN